MVKKAKKAERRIALEKSRTIDYNRLERLTIGDAVSALITISLFYRQGVFIVYREGGIVRVRKASHWH